MEIKRLRVLALEIFKTLNNLIPNFTKDIFNFSPYSTHRKQFLYAVEIHQIMMIMMIEASEVLDYIHGTPTLL